ncbi:L-rhamnose mutarotase [Polymorphospora sp. NPDC051019]|uniref:L-rhamnose mutarotase n=1 Tax=Polymorphospora sp. NPDC051019 TaxID=3155725 RepID=UPI00342B2F3B
MTSEPTRPAPESGAGRARPGVGRSDPAPGAQFCYLYRLRDGAGPEYDRRHAEVWPELSRLLDEAGMYDYSIFRRDTLVICVLRTRDGFDRARTLTAGSAVQARWTASLAGLFAEIADAEGEPLWAPRVFRHAGHPA